MVRNIIENFIKGRKLRYKTRLESVMQLKHDEEGEDLGSRQKQIEIHSQPGLKLVTKMMHRVFMQIR